MLVPVFKLCNTFNDRISFQLLSTRVTMVTKMLKMIDLVVQSDNPLLFNPMARAFGTVMECFNLILQACNDSLGASCEIGHSVYAH